MNGNDFDSKLADQLQHRASSYHPSPIPLEAVKRNAGRIRRRRASAAGAAFAVLAVGGGGGLVAALDSGNGNGSDLPVAAPTFTHQGNPTMPPPEDLPVNKGDRNLPGIDPTTLPRGEDPKVGWVHYGILHNPEGGEVQLPRDGLGTPYRYDDGWLLIDWAGRKDGATGMVVGADGQPVAPEFDTSGVVATSTDGSRVLFVAGDELTLHDNGTGRSTVVRTTDGQLLEPAGVDDAGSVYYNVADPVDGTTDGRIWRDGEETDPSPEADQPIIAANAQGFTTRVVELTDYGTCSAVFSPDGAEQARTCDWMPGTFSPDGTKVLLGPAYRDGAGALELGIAGEDWSAPLVERVNYGDDDQQGATFTDTVWEDDEHVLAVMYDWVDEQPTWWIVRIGTDGAAELASDPIPSKEEEGVELVR